MVANKIERCWRYLLANRQATIKDIVLNCDVTEEFAEEVIALIGSPNWRDPVADHASESERARLLGLAKQLTCGDRNGTYGPPYNNMSDCASLWETYMNAKNGYVIRVTAEDVAWMLVLLKMTRSFQPGYHPDNYVDASAYAAIAGECRDMQENGG
jgi:hypothetical protein